MPRYSYRARDEWGKTVKGVVECESEDRLALILRERSQYLISGKRLGEKPPTPRGARLRRKDLIAFTHHLASVLAGGVPLLQGLEEMGARAESRALRRVVEDIGQGVREGLSLSDALARHPAAFPPTYVSVVRAGEAAGKLDDVLSHQLRLHEWEEEFMDNVKSATAYPMVMLIAGVAIIAGLFYFAVPRLLEIVTRLNVRLPLITQVLMGISNFLSTYWGGASGSVVALAVGFFLFRGHPAGRYWLDRTKLGLPLVGRLVTKICMSRFAHYFALLHGAGVELLQTLEILRGVVGNAALSRMLGAASDRIRGGETITRSLAATGYFPPMVLRMISIGESTGELTEALGKVCQYYDREVPSEVKRFMAILQPALIVGLAGMLLFVALGLYLPIFRIIQGVSLSARPGAPF